MRRHKSTNKIKNKMIRLWKKMRVVNGRKNSGNSTSSKNKSHLKRRKGLSSLSIKRCRFRKRKR